MIQSQFDRSAGAKLVRLSHHQFTLLFRPSTTPEESAPLGADQFRINSPCERSVRTTLFIGSINAQRSRAMTKVEGLPHSCASPRP